MVEKLRSILRQIHWSSVLKASIAAIAWFYFPFWLFLIVALVAYFSPAAQARKTLAPFLTLIILAFLEPQGIAFAFIFGAVLFYILLIKNLLLIDRKSAYETLVLLLAFLFLRAFYLKFGGGVGGSSLFYGFFAACVLAFLFSNFTEALEDQSGTSPALIRPVRWLMFLVSWQFIIVGLFLPLDFIYQAVIVFLSLVFLVDLAPQYLFGDFSRNKMLVTGSAVFTIMVIVLGSARWGL